MKNFAMIVFTALFTMTTQPLTAGCHMVKDYCKKTVYHCVKVSRKKCVKWKKDTVTYECGAHQECESNN